MINLFKKKISKKWVALTTLVLGLFFKVKTVSAAGVLVPLAYAVAGIIAWFNKDKIVSLTLFGIIGGLASFLSWVVGMIQGVLTAILFQIMPYNNFINEDVVVKGWVMIRDLSNMFFILILLIIAFATILRIESYSWKKNLPKLLIMAVLINFSKTICGLAIDFGQVIMLTFANAFAAAGPANLYDAFGMKSLFTISKAGDALRTGGTITNQVKENLGFAVAGSLVLGLIMLIVATIVIATFVIILIFRIIMLWVLIILSPLAFLAMAIPAGTKYASQWMGEFTKYVVTGPVLAFFLWLALTMNANTSPLNITATDAIKQSGIESLGAGSEASQPNNMKNFIVTTLFLIAGLSMAQQIGGIGSSMGMNAVGKVKSMGLGLAKKGAKNITFATGRKLDDAQVWAQGGIAKAVSWATGKRLGTKYQAKSLNYRMIKEGWDRNKAIKMRQYEGTKSGAWQDKFNRTTSAAIGIPIVSQIMRNKAEKKAKEHENNIKEEQKLKEQDEILLKNTPATDTDKQNEIKERIKGREVKISNEKVKMSNEMKKSKTAWTLGEMPPQRYMRLQEQEKANEARARITKEEDLSEENLVHNAQVAEDNGNKADMRGYITHLTDINGLNTYFDAIGEDFNSQNIIKVFEKKFGDAAGDVLAEVSRRAEAVGNYKFMGLHKFDVAQGRNRVATVEEQSAYVARKDNEKYAQNHARTTHFDSLYDKTKKGVLTLSDNGLTQLLHIAASEGRMKEIGNGNYQTRYGEMVIKLEEDIKVKASGLEGNGRREEADGLLSVLKAFKENYSLQGKIDKKKSRITTGEKSDKGSAVPDESKGDKGPVLYDAYDRPIIKKDDEPSSD